MEQREKENTERLARVFLAIGISSAVASEVARTQQLLGRGAPAGLFRFGDARDAHVTLRFLGSRSPEEQGRIAGAAAVAGNRGAPFELGLGGLGVFPDERRPHTLWMGLKQGRSEVVALAKELAEALGRAGFLHEARPFFPHLTLARVRQRPPPGLIPRLLSTDVILTSVLRVETFMLMESRATREGVRYVPLRTFRLENACTPSA